MLVSFIEKYTPGEKKRNFLLSFLLLTLSSFPPPLFSSSFLPFHLPSFSSFLSSSSHSLCLFFSPSSFLSLPVCFLLLLLFYLFIYLFLLLNLMNPLVKRPLTDNSFTCHFVPFSLILSCSPLRNLLSYPYVHPPNTCNFLSYPLVVT